MKKIFFVMFILICCISCKEEPISAPEPDTPYELWLSKKKQNYSIDQMKSCFCPDAGELVRITVRSDTILSVINISDNSIVEYPHYYTIDSLFGIIQNSLNDSLVVEYNSEYGFPEFLDINPQQHPVDGGVLYITSNLQIEK